MKTRKMHLDCAADEAVSPTPPVNPSLLLASSPHLIMKYQRNVGVSRVAMKVMYIWGCTTDCKGSRRKWLIQGGVPATFVDSVHEPAIIIGGLYSEVSTCMAAL